MDTVLSSSRRQRADITSPRRPIALELAWHHDDLVFSTMALKSGLAFPNFAKKIRYIVDNQIRVTTVYEGYIESLMAEIGKLVDQPCLSNKFVEVGMYRILVFTSVRGLRSR